MQGSITIKITFDSSTKMIQAVVQDTGVGINKNELT